MSAENVCLTFIQQQSHNQLPGTVTWKTGQPHWLSKLVIRKDIYTTYMGGWAGRSGYNDGNKNCQSSTCPSTIPHTGTQLLVRNRVSAYFIPQPAENNTYTIASELVEHHQKNCQHQDDSYHYKGIGNGFSSFLASTNVSFLVKWRVDPERKVLW